MVDIARIDDLPEDLYRGFKMYRVRLIPKTESNLMRVIGWGLKVSRINNLFNQAYWTTLPRGLAGINVYYPEWVKDPLSEKAWPILRHEVLGHGPQFTGVVAIKNSLLYLARWPAVHRGALVMMSGTWLLERDPYLMDIKSGRLDITTAVESLWFNYGKPAPMSLMREWFEARLK